DRMVRKAEEKEREESNARNALAMERQQLASLQTGAADLIGFLDAWEPYFKKFSTPQSIEVELAMRVREANLVSLAQRFEQVGLKENSALPRSVRAVATFEDNYAALLNWIGRLEQDIPTLRIASLRLMRGTRPTDLRMEIVVDQPLIRE
ncbi:MAG: hypothetical protein N2322_07900, partial [Terrimicrobiaceae bacterium]|nr:hypothetical protein [Terrimicrobiaceae bacterium]